MNPAVLNQIPVERTPEEKAKIAHDLLNGQEGYVGIYSMDNKIVIHVNNKEFYEEVHDPFESKGYSVVCALGTKRQ